MRGYITLSPWNDINRMWNAMDRYWPNNEAEPGSYAFPIDVYEQDRTLHIRASVPGVKPDDLQVSLENGVLTITGETTEHYENRPGNRMYQREHSYGKFLRSVHLPDDIDENGIDAHFEHGVLNVTIPLSKPNIKEPKQIQVRKGAGHSSLEGRGEGKKAEEALGAGRNAVESKAYMDRPPSGQNHPSNNDQTRDRDKTGKR